MERAIRQIQYLNTMKAVIDLTVTVLVMDHTIVQQTELKIFVVADVTNVEIVKWKDRNILPIGDSSMKKVVFVMTVTVNVMVHGDAPLTGRPTFVVVLSQGHVLNAALMAKDIHQTRNFHTSMTVI